MVVQAALLLSWLWLRAQCYYPGPQLSWSSLRQPHDWTLPQSAVAHGKANTRPGVEVGHQESASMQIDSGAEALRGGGRAGGASRLLCGCGGGGACEVTFAASFQMMACIRVEKPHLSCLSTSSPSAASISPCGGARKEKEKYAGVQKKEYVGRRGVTPTRGSLHTPEASVRASAGKLQSNRVVAKKEVVPAAGTGAGAGGPPA